MVHVKTSSTSMFLEWESGAVGLIKLCCAQIYRNSAGFVVTDISELKDLTLNDKFA